MVNPPRQTMRDYYKRTDIGRISLGFQPSNHVTFAIKNVVLVGLRDNQFDVSIIRDMWEHVIYFYETCSLCNLDGLTESRVKLRLFGFSLTRRAKDWLQCLPSGIDQTWTELEENFLERFFSNA